MGVADDFLVGPAILYNNPGITREEFAELLLVPQLSDFKFKKSDPWRDFPIGFPSTKYFGGLNGIAHLLNLEHSADFMDKTSRKETPEGIVYSDFNVCNLVFLRGYTPQEDDLYVYEHKEVELLEEYDTESIFYISPEIGQNWDNPELSEFSNFSAIIRDVYMWRDLDVEERDYYCHPSGTEPEYLAKIRVLEYEIKGMFHEFKTLDELHDKFPFTLSDNMYNWSQESGNFHVWGPFNDVNNFRWKKVGDKYYFDEDCFVGMKASINDYSAGEHKVKRSSKNRRQFGYTDLIVTAQACKQEAWKLLSNQGNKRFLDDFFNDFPDSFARYKSAVWDVHTSLFAANQGMSTFDYMRMHQLGLSRMYDMHNKGK